ncbi:CapA family protein [Pseudomonas mucidolens]|uniref:CapA family protein n=1 Tax=Pseudomonas mucidolens TaxID=46679 RepID=UPI0030DB30D5
MLYEAEQGNFCLMATGDLLVSRRLGVFREPAYLALRALLRGADMTLGNLETVLHRFEHWPGSAGGTFTGCPPEILADLRWLGFGLLSVANNHAADYGIPGLLGTLEHLERAGFAYAGAGTDLFDASEPTYVETAAGRVALLACSASFAPGSEAMTQHHGHCGRPGINPLLYQRRYQVDEASILALARLRHQLGLDTAEPQRRNLVAPCPPAAEAPQRLEVFGQSFELSEGFSLHTELDQTDARRHTRRVGEAKAMADWVIVSCHWHERGASADEPPAFLRDFARRCIDAGADVFVAHGPHTIRGIEIYKDRPIFYSMGNFVFQNETVIRQPSASYQAFNLGPDASISDLQNAKTRHGTTGFAHFEEYWRSFIAQVSFRKGALAGVRLHPIDLGFGLPRSQHGRPVLAAGDVAAKTLAELQALSSRYGTVIISDRNVGEVRL